MQIEDTAAMKKDSLKENPEYLEKQLITYIGSKRNLLDFIGKGIEDILRRTGKDKLNIFDAFTGSGVVARYLKRYANRLITNDLELYSNIISRCYLSNSSELDLSRLKNIHQDIIFELENNALKKGIISKFYTPYDDQNIKKGERTFYTNRNAKYIDTARHLIGKLQPEIQHFFLAPLLSEASIHANTSGVFKGFYKDSKTKLGKYGGNNNNALKRILGDIHLPFPIFSKFDCDVEIHHDDSNKIAKEIKNIDVTYIDPPYNQHPYGSNYFMLNLIARNIPPNNISTVSGIPTDWNRSNYNKKRQVFQAFDDLVSNLDSRFLLISFNSEGFIRREEMINLLEKYGSAKVLEAAAYNTFRGSRNLNNRGIYVTEYLYLLEKN